MGVGVGVDVKENKLQDLCFSSWYQPRRVIRRQKGWVGVKYPHMPEGCGCHPHAPVSLCVRQLAVNSGVLSVLKISQWLVWSFLPFSSNLLFLESHRTKPSVSSPEQPGCIYLWVCYNPRTVCSFSSADSPRQSARLVFTEREKGWTFPAPLKDLTKQTSLNLKSERSPGALLKIQMPACY